MAGEIKSPYVHPSTFEIVDGVIHLPHVTKEFLSQIKELPVQPNDVFIASYPKSGTTWVAEIVWQINCDGETVNRCMGERVPFFEELRFLEVIKTKEDLLDVYLKHPSPRSFKVHLRYNEVPMGDGDANRPKYIYVARNPKDTAVSYYHHYRMFKVYGFDPDRTWDEFFYMFINNKVHYSSWFDNVLSWWAHRDDDNVLFLKYEDMKKDLPGAVKMIAKFLGKSLSPGMIERIANQTSFGAMSDGKGRFYDSEAMKPYTNKDCKFIRKGQVGDWKNYFTKEQSAIFEQIYKEKITGSGLEFEF